MSYTKLSNQLALNNVLKQKQTQATATGQTMNALFNNALADCYNQNKSTSAFNQSELANWLQAKKSQTLIGKRVRTTELRAMQPQYTRQQMNSSIGGDQGIFSATNFLDKSDIASSDPTAKLLTSEIKQGSRMAQICQRIMEYKTMQDSLSLKDIQSNLAIQAQAVNRVDAYELTQDAHCSNLIQEQSQKSNSSKSLRDNDEQSLNKLPIMGSDEQRKNAIAQTRYMDKQKLNPLRSGEDLAEKSILTNDATVIKTTQTKPNFERQALDALKFEKPQIEQKKAVYPYLCTKHFDVRDNDGPGQNHSQSDSLCDIDSEDLSVQILQEIPKLLMYQNRSCKCDCASSQINSKLLKYFLDNEFQKKQEASKKKKQISLPTEHSPVKCDTTNLKQDESYQTQQGRQNLKDYNLENIESASYKTAIESDKKEEFQINLTAKTEGKDEELTAKDTRNNSSEHVMESSEVLQDSPSDSLNEKKADEDDQKDMKLTLTDFQKHQAKPVTMCPHKDRKHYAKNMCSSCYRKYGRNQNATKCGHPDRLLYSMGMCQTCYMADYHQRRTKPMKKLIQKQLIKQGILIEKSNTSDPSVEEQAEDPSPSELEQQAK